MAILKHIASKSSNYGAALEYLIFKHDEIRKAPILDQNGNRIMRDEFYLDGLNCEPYDCSKVSNTVAQNCTHNQINKNNLRLNQLNRTKEAYGRYRNVFLEDYSELEMEIAELDTLIDDLSIYMQSTGKKYTDHAATLRSWSARKKRQQKPGTGIPDYTYSKEESL